MKKIYLATLLLSLCNAIFAMDRSYELPHKEVIKDRLRYKINKHFGGQFGTNIGYNFVETTDLQIIAKQYLGPLSVVSYAHSVAHQFCSQHMDKAKAINTEDHFKQIILYELLKDHPRAIEALQNNYGFLPRKIK